MIKISLTSEPYLIIINVNVDPLNPLLKLDFTGVNIIFNNFAVKYVSWVLVGTASLRNTHNIVGKRSHSSSENCHFHSY